MRHGSLFSGIGGFDLAAEWMGWENVFHCEWNPFGQKVLKHYWPHSISYNDITKTDFSIHRGDIDIITGGFPCQPYSSAGKRLGKDDERHLWPEMLRCIREIKPRWIVGENVLGLVNWNGGMVFEEVQADLEAEGYEVQPYVLPAAGKGAPHLRQRVWFVAYNTNRRIEEMHQWSKYKNKTEFITNTLQIRLQQCKNGTEMAGGQEEVCRTRSESSNGIEANGEISDVADTNNKGLERDASKRIQTNERRRNRIQNGIFNRMGKQSNWKTFPTVSPVCNGDDGLSSRLDSITFPKWRNESIKAGGNAVVPQVVYQIFKAIEQYGKQNTGKDQSTL